MKAFGGPPLAFQLAFILHNELGKTGVQLLCAHFRNVNRLQAGVWARQIIANSSGSLKTEMLFSFARDGTGSPQGCSSYSQLRKIIGALSS